MRNRSKTTSERPNPLPSDILLTLPELGIEVESVKSDEAWALCPSPKHYERSASWSINLTTGEHNCFSCGFGGNFLFLVEKVRNLEEGDATDWVRKRGGIDVALKKLRGEKGYSKKKAQEVTEADLVMFDTDIPGWALRQRDIIQEACEAYGILWNREWVTLGEHKVGPDTWILPVRDPFTQELRGWQEKSPSMMINHPEFMEKADTLFGYHLLGETAYVEESPLDCARLWTYSIEGAVSGYGVHISDEQMDLIIDHPKVKRVVMCLDNDRAGRRKEAEIWRKYRGRTRLYFANYDGIEEKDHGEMDPEEIAYSLEKAISALRFRP